MHSLSLGHNTTFSIAVQISSQDLRNNSSWLRKWFQWFKFFLGLAFNKIIHRRTLVLCFPSTPGLPVPYSDPSGLSFYIPCSWSGMKFGSIAIFGNWLQRVWRLLNGAQQGKCKDQLASSAMEQDICFIESPPTPLSRRHSPKVAPFQLFSVNMLIWWLLRPWWCGRRVDWLA